MNNEKTPWFVLRSPELGQPFQKFFNVCKEKGVLDKKTKELLMLALASVFRCPYCTEKQIRSALDAGVTKEEITEALIIAAVVGAGAQLTCAKNIFMKHLT